MVDNETIQRARSLYESGEKNLRELMGMLEVTSRMGALFVMRKLGPVKKGKKKQPEVDIEKVMVAVMKDEGLRTWIALTKAAGYESDRRMDVQAAAEKHKKASEIENLFEKRTRLHGKEAFKRLVAKRALELGYVPSAKEFDYSRLYEYYKSAAEFWADIGLEPNKRGKPPEPLPSKFKAAHSKKRK